MMVPIIIEVIISASGSGSVGYSERDYHCRFHKQNKLQCRFHYLYHVICIDASSDIGVIQLTHFIVVCVSARY